MSNEKFDDYWYKTLNISSLWAYLSHYLWIVIVCQICIRPFKLTFINAWFVNFIGAEVLILLSYYLIDYIVGKFGGKKKKDR